MSSEPLRVGLLSTARINDKVIGGARASDEVEVVAVGSRDADRARAYAAENGIPRSHGSYEALLADPDVEAVYISLPNGMHVDWSIRSLEAGKHVLCEKPLTAKPDEVARAFDAAERSGLHLTEAFMWRHNPQTAKLAELVRDGAIGELVLVRSCFGFDIRALSEDDVRLNASLEGGALMDVGCYCVSASRLLAGEPELVQGMARERNGVDVLFGATMRHGNGVLAQFECGFVVQDRHEVEAVGTDGSLLCSDPFHGRRPGLELRGPKGVERIDLTYADPYRLELENLAAAVRGRAALLLSRDDALGQARTIGALYRSAAEGRAVEVA